MNFYNNLPLPARIGIPALLVVILGFLVWTMALKPPAPVTVINTQDISVYNTAKDVLRQQNIKFDESPDIKKGTYSLTVAASKTNDAATALEMSGVKDRSIQVKNIACPAPPGFTGTRAANERSDNCENAKKVQGMLLAAGAVAANVSVSQMENTSLDFGSEKAINVVAQVFLPDTMRDHWSAEQAAEALAGAVGTTPERVTLTDDQLQILYSGASNSKKSEDGSDTSKLGCDDVASATEISTKETAVSNCTESKISDKLEELLGSTQYFVLAVDTTVNASASTTEITRNSKGPASSTSTQSGGGTNTSDVNTPPNTTSTTKVQPAGDVSRQSISVTLDKSHVSADQELAVKRVLATFVVATRKDPAPTVTRIAFKGGTGDKPNNDEFEAIKKQAEANSNQPPAAAPVATSSMPKPLLAAMAVVIVGLVTTILVLWRRSAGMAAERARLAAEFQNDQRLFENYAQQNPADIARDLEALFGAPSAPEPQYN